MPHGNRFERVVRKVYQEESAQEKQRANLSPRKNRVDQIHSAAQAIAERLSIARMRRDREELKLERKNAQRGMLPEVVWGEEAGQLCREFLTYVERHRFKGAMMLQNGGEEYPWKIRGYGVGIYPYTYPYAYSDQSPKQVSLPYHVFLCEDGNLRTYLYDNIEAQGLANHITNLLHDSFKRPYAPMCGRFYNMDIGAVYEVGQGNAYEGHLVRRVKESSHKEVRIQEHSLEEILEAHAMQAAGVLKEGRTSIWLAKDVGDPWQVPVFDLHKAYNGSTGESEVFDPNLPQLYREKWNERL